MIRRDYETVPRVEFDFINLLRGPAALMVVYSHLVGAYLSGAGETYWLKKWIDTLFTKPMIIVHDFGQLGVMVFFLISGFLITHVARLENRATFVLRRIFRIYPSYLFFVGLCFILWSVGFSLHGTESFHQLEDWSVILRWITLTNYFFFPQHIILGVAWTLAIEILFYALVLILMPLIRRAPTATILIELVLVAACIVTAKFFGDSWYLFSATVAYLPYLFIGQVIYFFWAGGMSGARAMLFGWLCYFAVVYGVWVIHSSTVQPSNSKILSLIFALGVFCWAMKFGKIFGKTRLAKQFSNVSYSLYLVHGPVGVAILTALHPHIGYSAALLLSVGIVILLAFGIHYGVERPAIGWGRRLSNIVGKYPSKAIN